MCGREKERAGLVKRTGRVVRHLTSASLVALSLCLLCSCRRHDYRVMPIHVPEMNDDQAARIAVDAVSCELVRNDANFTVDRKTFTVACAAGGSLKAASARARIEDALRQVGLEGKVVGVQHTPTESWRDRHTATVRVSQMLKTKDVNVAVHAIARAVRGDNKDVTLDRATRTITVKYDSLLTSLKNLEHSIANAGLQANDVPANIGKADALQHGWR